MYFDLKLKKVFDRKSAILFLSLIILMAFVGFLMPFNVDAQTDYVPLAPIGSEIPDAPINAENYIRGLFIVAIGAAGILAVIMITLGGIQYMTTDAISGKTEGKAVITRALLGLILALASWLILYTINPNILNFSLNPQAPPQQSSGGYISSICATTQEECEQYYNATLESDCVPPPTTCSESSEGNWCIAYGFCPPVGEIQDEGYYHIAERQAGYIDGWIWDSCPTDSQAYEFVGHLPQTFPVSAGDNPANASNACTQYIYNVLDGPETGPTDCIQYSCHFVSTGTVTNE